MTTQRMTPEQRASELLCAAERMARVGRPFGNSREDMFDALTAAITSAEDEAIERAAEEVDESLFEGLAEGGIDGPASIGHIRDLIRSLKTGGV